MRAAGETTTGETLAQIDRDLRGVFRRTGIHIDDRRWHLTKDDFMIVNSNEVHSVDSPLPNETIVLQIPLKLFEDYFTGEQFIWFSHEPGRRDERFMELVRELSESIAEKPAVMT